MAAEFPRIDIGGYGGIGIIDKDCDLLRGEGRFLYRKDALVAGSSAKR